MKKIIRLLLALILCLALAAPAFAEDQVEVVESGTKDSVSYTLLNNGSLSITGSGMIPVTAFSERKDITSVSIGEGIAEIGIAAFSGCTNITSVSLPSTFAGIQSYAFRNCKSLEKIDIPDSVTELGDYAFDGCSKLSYAKLSASLTNIGDYVFMNCGLTEVIIPEGVPAIRRAMFSGCAALTKIELPRSVTSIKESAFADCTSLTATIHRTANTDIAGNAFNRVAKLTVLVPYGWTGDTDSFGASSVIYDLDTRPGASYPEEGYYRIRTELGTDYCLDIGEGTVGGQTIENARIWRAGSSKNGVFHLERDYEHDAYIIREPKSNKILDVFGTGSAEGMTVMLWNDDGADDQRWIFKDIDGNGHYMICTMEYGYLYANGLGNDYDVCCMPYKNPANSSREIWVLERVNYTGSVLSQGNVWIVAAVAVVAAGTVAALVITKKKKPAADKTEE